MQYMYLTIALLCLPIALCAPVWSQCPMCTTPTHSEGHSYSYTKTHQTQDPRNNREHFRVARAVFDIIPTVDPTMGDTGKHHMEERQAGDSCKCEGSEHLMCFLDTKLKCRVSLQMEPDSSWATMKKLGTEGTKARRGKFKRNKKKQLRKLFAKWLEQKKKENGKT